MAGKSRQSLAARIAGSVMGILLLVLVMFFALFSANRASRNVYDELLNETLDARAWQALDGMRGRGEYELLWVVGLNPFKSTVLADESFASPSDYVRDSKSWECTTSELLVLERTCIIELHDYGSVDACFRLAPTSIDDLTIHLYADPSGPDEKLPYNLNSFMKYHRSSHTLEVGLRSSYLAFSHWIPDDEALACFNDVFLRDYFASVGKNSPFAEGDLGEFTIVYADSESDGDSERGKESSWER